jgi:hypothetical protein
MVCALQRDRNVVEAVLGTQVVLVGPLALLALRCFSSARHLYVRAVYARALRGFCGTGDVVSMLLCIKGLFMTR